MTKKETAYIQALIKKFEQWYDEECELADKETDPEAQAEHSREALKNRAIYISYKELLKDLQEL